ncbi:unnamed protein product [Discosporangium mesarthrocarpum]
MGNVLDCSSDPLDQTDQGDGGEHAILSPSNSKTTSPLVEGEASVVRGFAQVAEAMEPMFLETSVPLRDSIMWKLQREYYVAHHVRCWERMLVPCFVTSNSFIANAYARVLAGFMRDWFVGCQERADATEPMIILEIGSGHGKFACLALQHLLDMEEFLPRLSSQQKNGGCKNTDTGTRSTAMENGHCDTQTPTLGDELVEEAGGHGDQGKVICAAESRQARGGGEGNKIDQLDHSKDNGSGYTEYCGSPSYITGQDHREVRGGETGTTPVSMPRMTKTGINHYHNDDKNNGKNSGNAQITQNGTVEVEGSEQGGKRGSLGEGEKRGSLGEGGSTTGGGSTSGSNPRRTGTGQGHFLPFKYVVTDVAQGTLDFVRAHPSMQRFIDMGILEVAILDGEDPSPLMSLNLQISGETLNLDEVKNPVAAVCNYVVDTLVQDAFRVKDGVLYENRVSITAERHLPNDLSRLSMKSLEGLGLQWDHINYEVGRQRANHYYANLQELGIHTATTTSDGYGGGGGEGTQDSNESTLTAQRKTHPSASESRGQSGLGVGRVFNGLDRGDNGGSEIHGIIHKADPCAVMSGTFMTQGVYPEAGGGGETGTRLGLGSVSRPEESGASRGGHAGDADFDAILREYIECSRCGDSSRDGFGDDWGSLLIPLGGLRLVRRLSSLGGGRCLVLAGDKGYNTCQEMKGQRNPHIAYHGSLSCMANLDALCRYTRMRGGFSLCSPYMEGFKCQALVFGLAEDDLEETRLQWEDAMVTFGPESFTSLQRAVKEELPNPSLKCISRLLRLSQLDPDIFMKFKAALVQQVSSQELAPSTWTDLKNDVEGIASHWYQLQQGKDVSFELARLLMALKDFESALHLFQRSSSLCGEHHVTHHNMGMCHFYLGQLQEAKSCFEKSISMNQGYEDAHHWLAHTKRSISPPVLQTASLRSGIRIASALSPAL